MTAEIFAQVDNLLTRSLIKNDPILDAAIQRSEAAGLPAIQVAPREGALLQLLAKLTGANRILEIGTLGGYSTIWLARALGPSGRLITLEFEPRHAEVARQNVAAAGFSEQVEVITGPALEALPNLTAPFDFIFIDADKRSVPAYIEWALRLSQPGTLIVVDNIVRNGAILDAHTEDPDVKGIQTFLSQIGQNPQVTVTALETVGSKGFDGMALILAHA